MKYTTVILITLITLTFGCCFSQEITDPTNQVSSLLSISSHDFRLKSIDSIVTTYRSHPNQKVIEAANNLLKQSFKDTFLHNDRLIVARLIGKLSDPSSISLLLAHITDLNPHIFPSENSFEENYPYANALLAFGNSAIFALLDALRKPHSYLFTKMCRGIIMRSYDPHVLLKYYETVQNDQTDDIIAEEIYLLVNTEGCDKYMDSRISLEKDPQKKSRLIQLLNKLDAMKPHLLEME